jgi:F-type H+-transporting ATPase subunit b
MDYIKILQKLNFDIRIFIFQLINFLIIAFIIKKFLYEPLHKVIYKRKLQIKRSVIAAQYTKSIINDANNEKNKIINSAQQDADKLLIETKQYINKLKEKALIDINNQAKQIIETARKTADNEYKNMKREIEYLSVNIAEITIKKVLSDLFNEKEKHQLIIQALNKINIVYEQNTN